MKRCNPWTAPTIGLLLLACGPAAARASRPASTSPDKASGPSGSAGSPRSSAATTPPRAAFVCRVDVEIREAERAQGTGASDTSATEAHDLAWRRACDDLRARSGFDCEDDARVRVVKRSSSTRAEGSPDGARAHYEQVFELVGFRLARGEAGSDSSFAQACTTATDNACRATLGTACPEGRVVVLKAEGDGQARPPTGPPPRKTI
jgi:hypothetical protein